MDSQTVRRGGKWTPEGFVFELTGGDPSLDFVNTVDMRPSESPKELLETYDDVCSWARQAGLITRRQEAALGTKASRMPEEAEGVRRQFVEARECLFRVFSALVDEEKVPGEALKLWNRIAHRAYARFELEPAKGRFEWRHASGPEELDFMLWPIVHSAVRLVTGADASRIRRCASADCDWMFLDRSKRGNRRWCDMTVCGNREKARRFYRRRKGK